MNNKTRILPALFILSALLLAWPSLAVAQPTNADFQQAVTAYQQTPSSETYEKVIRMAAAMNQLPPIPEEARRHFVMGQTMFKSAKSTNDFAMASQEFLQCINLAPWWPEALYNLALGCEAAGDYATAIRNLKNYQLFKLPEAEARTAQDKIYTLEAKQKMAEQEKEMAEQTKKLAAQKAAEDQRARQEAAEETPEAKKQRELQALLSKIDGRRYKWAHGQPGGGSLIFLIDVKSSVFVTGVYGEGMRDGNEYTQIARFDIKGRETWHQLPPRSDIPGLEGYEVYTIGDDGERITVHTHYRNGGVDERVFFWQR